MSANFGKGLYHRSLIEARICLYSIRSVFEYLVLRLNREKQPFADVFRKKPMLEFVFNKTLKPATLLKRDSTRVFSPEYCGIFQNSSYL